MAKNRLNIHNQLHIALLETPPCATSIMNKPIPFNKVVVPVKNAENDKRSAMVIPESRVHSDLSYTQSGRVLLAALHV